MEIPKAMIEAGARAMVSRLCVYIDMDAPNMQHQADYYRRIAADVIRAAMVGVEVVFQPKREHPDITINAVVIVKDANWTSEYPPVPLNDGDTLAVFRGGV